MAEPRLNWIDRAIAYLSPQRGAARAQSRAMMAVLLSYEGASRGRRTKGWTSHSGTSGDAEAGTAHRLLRDRARDLVRNNPHATKGLAVIVSNKIGTGILCSPAGAGANQKKAESALKNAEFVHPIQAARLAGARPNLRKANRLQDLWKRWIDDCDITGRSDFYGVQSLAERTRAEAGEGLVRFVPVRASSTRDVPVRLQVMEPDLLDSDKHENLGGGRQIRYGIEYEGYRPVAYWLFDAHPGDATPLPRSLGFKSRRIPASEVIHFYKTLRPGQTRGVTDFAPVMIRLLELDDYAAAELMRKKVAACLAAFVTTPTGLPGASLAPVTTGANGERVETFEPGMVSYIGPGESVTVADPKPSTDYADFHSAELHAIAAGLCVPYELLTGDLSEVTYTSHRGGLVQFRGMVEADQWQVVVPQLCERVTRRFAAEAAGIDGMVDPDALWTYTPPRFALLDPAKEIPAMIAAVRSGIDSFQNVVRREGYDPDEKLDEHEWFKSELERRGLEGMLTADGRAPLTGAKDKEEADEAAAA